jgi:hypothetical protein
MPHILCPVRIPLAARSEKSALMKQLRYKAVEQKTL